MYIYKKQGFTLAEVLITLGIIGVVAALTMPSLIQNYKKKEYSVRLKKFNSVMANALRLSEYENGGNLFDNYSGTALDFFTAYIAPHLIYTKIIKSPSGRYLDSVPVEATVFFNDGTLMDIRVGACMGYLFDVNGDAKPNATGRDQFGFVYCGNNTPNWKTGWGPYDNSGLEFPTRDLLLTQCKREVAATYCSGLLQYDDWEFKDDYPYKL